MTPEQFGRWRDFSLRMARACYADSRRPPAHWIVEHVTELLLLLEEYRDDIVDWDGGVGLFYVCDYVSNYEYDLMGYRPRSECASETEEERDRLFEFQWLEQWGGPVRACVRAGLDVASEPNVGVIGFTVGDIRAMYPEGIPDWVDNGFIDPDTGAAVRLSEAPDNHGVWL